MYHTRFEKYCCVGLVQIFQRAKIKNGWFFFLNDRLPATYQWPNAASNILPLRAFVVPFASPL